MPFSIKELLDRSRKELLDLSTRNRLLSIPVDSKSARIIQVHDERSDQVYRLLVNENKSLSFLPTRGSPRVGVTSTTELTTNIDDDEEISLPQPEDDEVLINGVAKRHVDLRLQTALSPEGLQRRVLSLYHDSLTTIEEQGVNVLYLALGHLRWYEADQSDTPRYAPLILVPVELHRKSAAERFYLRWREEDIEENLSLAARLKQDFDIELPPFPESEEFIPTDYFKSIEKTIGVGTNWEVLPDAVTLGFFSFAKFLMYRDLDAENWNDPDLLLKHPFVTALLQDGFPSGSELIQEDANIDEIIPASRLDHVVDADNSQTIAIEVIRQGRSVVIQGPPGTGKSQSITNIIANAVLDGKRVLFVAEKLAALQVVKQRLEKEALGPVCLELHSNKSNKRTVIEEIGRTWKLGRPRRVDLEAVIPKLEEHRSTLNTHAKLMHEPHSPSGLTPFMIIGELALLGQRGREASHIKIEGCESWTKDERIRRRALLEEIVRRIQHIGLPSHHPWRGVCKNAILPIDLPAIESTIRQLSKCLVELKETIITAAATLARPEAKTLNEAKKERAIAEYIGKSPDLDKQALCDSVWGAGIESLAILIQTGEQFASICSELRSRVTEATWESDLSVARNHIVAHGKSLFRLLHRDYRSAIAQLKGTLTIALPKSRSDRVNLINRIIIGQKAYKHIAQNDHIGKSAFGRIWNRDKSEWNKLRMIFEWFSHHEEAGLGAGFQAMVAGVDDTAKSLQLSELLQRRLFAASHSALEMQDQLHIDLKVAFTENELHCIPLDDFSQRCQLWLERMEDLSSWNNYYVLAERARTIGLSSLVDRLQNGDIATSAALDSFDRVYLSQLLRSMTNQRPELAQFDGELHRGIVSEFRKIDRDRLELAKYRVLNAHFESMPASSGIGQAGIVKAEMERKRGHRPVRKLLKDAGSVVQAIKPVFMMSPLSVAQFLEPGTVEFDLLVIDEASQVQPVDALGPIARCKQIVVVGDQKQLPPTHFFSRLTTDAAEIDEEEIETAEAKDIESILGLCRARGLPETMLRWHYRSRHHSLIAVSNHEFYDDRLFIVPSPHSSVAKLGLKFNHIADGIFDSGASRTNRLEARVVCRAILEHARNSPKLSLGVATFSVNQRQAILDELELLRRENPNLEPFFSNQSTEPFFVKNLENVQGDERDVIFISIGYGRDTHGFMAMRFGPLSNEGGERRLNVLISRAKQRCEVFSSITADDIDLERASGRGVAALKTFLSFARTGKIAVSERSGRDEQSPFEEAVHRAVESLGYEVHTQVGIAGFFIDLAVIDRERHGRYVLGIECDGAAYHSSRSARDRDRLRQSVLEQHGWIIHRIWSTDWFQRPGEQLKKVAEAVRKAQSAYDDIVAQEGPRGTVSLEEGFDKKIERETISELDDDGFGKLAVPYNEARFPVPKRFQPHELATKQMEEVVHKIVELEGPIHEDEIVNRVRDLWGLGRAGTRIQNAVTRAVRSLLGSTMCERESGFVSIPNAAVPIRNRENVSSISLKKPEMIPPSEISIAILKLIEVHHGATRDEIPVAIARLLGFRSTSTQLRHVIEAIVIKLFQDAMIEEKEGMMQKVDHA